MKIKRIDIKEFREKGFLQEVNRKFLHPLGLALEVSIDDNGNETLGGVWDYRDDPEGMIFGENQIQNDKIAHVEELFQSKKINRENLLVTAHSNKINLKGKNYE